MDVARRELVRGSALLAMTAMAAQAPGQGRPEAPTGAASVQRLTFRTTPLFRSPALYPNALAVNTDAPGGLWIGQQKISLEQAAIWGQPVPADRDEAAWLVDWRGRLLKTVRTPSRNTSGMAYGDRSVWMGANADPFGIFQVDLAGRVLSHRQIPLAPPGQPGGGCHGCQWHEGKLWIASLRLGGAVRVDPVSWVADIVIPIRSDARPRLHDLTFDGDGNLWIVIGNTSHSYAEARPGLAKYDGRTGRLLAIADLAPHSADPHGLAWHDGTFYSCDAGVHPDGWRDRESPFSGMIFKLELA